ncbi:MAG: nuclear transport factor 2 family protein [Candidatus Promineifilaceae bacterium]|nr:nuclear transport factor 2 family protein [Candidatus Promineifilaceae bacterium]
MTQDQDDKLTVAQAERDLARAHVDLDLRTIDCLLHEEYTILQPNGEIEDKSAVLDSYKKGDRRWQSAAADDLQVAITGNLALVSGRWTAAGHNGSGPFAYSARFLSMWRKDNGHWQNVAYQSTEIIE